MKKKLYVGIDCPDSINEYMIHYPVIKIIPRPKEKCLPFLSRFLSFTHFIFTSKSSVRIFFDYLRDFSYSNEEINQKIFVAVGKKTALSLQNFGVKIVKTADDETAEGVIALLKNMDLKTSFIFWPHSALSRPVLTDFFFRENLKFETCIFYDTVPHLNKPLPELETIDEIFFTSPSTVDAFFLFFTTFPKNIKLNAIGPITKEHLLRKGFGINSKDGLSSS